MLTETDLELGDGRRLHVYDAAGEGRDARLTVFWHHGTPNLGAPPEPLFPAADRLGRPEREVLDEYFRRKAEGEAAPAENG